MMRPRWLVAGLIVSVALNLFLIGAAAAVIALSARLAHAPPPLRAGALYWATDGLPQPDRRQMRLMLLDLRDEVQPDTNRSLALRAAAWDGLNAPAPDAAAIKAKLSASRQIDIGIRTRVEEKIVDYAVRLPPADRATLAAGMRRVLTPRTPAVAAPATPLANATR